MSLTFGLMASSSFAATDLQQWTLSVPVDTTGEGRSDNISENQLADGYQLSPYFEQNAEANLIFLAPIAGPKTSENTKYTRSELREMLRRGDTKIRTKGVTANNWVFSTAPKADQQAAGGIDGVLEADLAVNHVTTTGEKNQIGRVIIGQIHANDDEPIRLYYRKLPHHNKGSIYFAHEPLSGDEQWYEMIGGKSSSIAEPEDGIELNERFSYRIEVVGNQLSTTIIREGKPDINKTIDMSKSGYDLGGQYMYFKAGVYNQNSTGLAEDYVKATFYRIDVSH
ncbi:polysaccharide lyase family 7 protein [Photobacterium sp. ZSDE20]|uniref:Polysaccharide lyase family 7 protein n=1 Tax=Photobacterium pectinilyticum TaxID=2906793 RepID=A0ABT1MZR4_9GAMM|nr:polysaccharide lyase family 7 protein [Photobacterium sp. ZSDE20]MCQ1057993.1 polysaccharide lyase family 7 protein [Photobacterium sp. ZSDE20]MDD1822526.1 polysaccharide lyase family 7 protein [Photobacterium sp. ZSDE20]